jgi:hypothetical protein
VYTNQRRLKLLASEAKQVCGTEARFRNGAPAAVDRELEGMQQSTRFGPSTSALLASLSSHSGRAGKAERSQPAGACQCSVGAARGLTLRRGTPFFILAKRAGVAGF